MDIPYIIITTTSDVNTKRDDFDYNLVTLSFDKRTYNIFLQSLRFATCITSNIAKVLCNIFKRMFFERLHLSASRLAETQTLGGKKRLIYIFLRLKVLCPHMRPVCCNLLCVQTVKSSQLGETCTTACCASSQLLFHKSTTKRSPTNDESYRRDQTLEPLFSVGWVGW